MIIIAIMLVCAATTYWLLKPAARIKGVRRVPAKGRGCDQQHSPYRAASITYGGCACASVKSLGNKRFLASKAPQVPLANCDSGKCQCRYIRHKDRRAGEDRRAAYCLQTDLHIVEGNQEQRSNSMRRSSDRHTGIAAGLDYSDFKWAT